MKPAARASKTIVFLHYHVIFTIQEGKITEKLVYKGRMCKEFSFFDFWSGADKHRFGFCWQAAISLGSLATDAASELDVLWHDGHTLCVDGAKVGVFEETNKIRFSGLLESKYCGALES